MNRNLLKCFSSSLLTFLMFLVSCEKMSPYHEDGSEITSAEAVEIVRPILDKYAQDGRGYYVGKNPIPANTTMKYGPLGYYDPSMEGCGTFKSPRFKAWLIVIGMDTSINGSKYMQPHLFVDVVTGTFKEVDVEGEVSGIEWDDSFGITVDDPTPFRFSTDNPIITRKQVKGRRSLSSTDGLYAVIINGGWNRENNHPRYWFDCQYVYQRLTQTLGYDESHIFCLVSDGTEPCNPMGYLPGSLGEYYRYRPAV